MVSPLRRSASPVAGFRWLIGAAICIAAASACKTTETAASGDFVQVGGGTYVLGTANHLANPKRTVTLGPFAIATHEVTNREFAEFVAATGYVTFAEKRHDAQVFYPGLAEFRWHRDSTAFWRFPNGIAYGGIVDKMDHPVTCICFHDIEAYCKWAGVRLPTLDEWEAATRAGSRSQYFWGNDRRKMKQYANVWYGRDHLVADTTDPWLRTSPVGSLAPNPLGLYDVYGNVFEFCANRPDYWAADSLFASARGGSWWCSQASCSFFNSNDIGKVRRVASFSNLGFRVVAVGPDSEGSYKPKP